MACSEEAMKYNDVTDILFNTFGAVLHRDTIYSIVETCYGDLNHAANVIMSITSDENSVTVPVDSNTESTVLSHATTKKTHNRNKNNTATSTKSSTETMSLKMHSQADHALSSNVMYSEATTSKKKDTMFKQMNTPVQNFPMINIHNNCSIWSEQMRRIVTYHNQGTRTLVIMRGAPGSGKTYLARQIQEMTVGATPEQLHIFCTDDYFMVNGNYNYDKMNLQSAHIWNQRRAFKALERGTSPVIIDNTNVEYWEIQPYAKKGVYHGYILEVVEPNTPWAKNLHQLTSRNKHRVPSGTIKRMLENLMLPITPVSLMKNLKLVYLRGMEPPVLRCLPTILLDADENSRTEKTTGTSQQMEVKNQNEKRVTIDFKTTSTTTTTVTRDSNLNDNSNAELCEANTQLNKENKYTVEEEGTCSELILDTRTPKLNYDEHINEDSSDIKNKKKDNEITVQMETLATNEKLNTHLDSDHIDQYVHKCNDQSQINQQNNNKVESNDFQKSGSQPYNLTKHITDGLNLEEASQTIVLTNTAIREEKDSFEKLLEEFQKVESEWDKGESWEDDTNTNKKDLFTRQLNTCNDAKLPRNRRNKETSLQPIDSENDWRKMYTPMTSIIDNNNVSLIPSKNVVETKSTETCMEAGDINTSSIKHGFKILIATARDINLNYLPNLNERIPESRKFDKSSMTNEITIMSGAPRCKNEDKHFIRFRNMFKHIRKEVLRDIFDHCLGDVNWAVSIVMDDTPNNQFEVLAEDEQSELEEEADEPCNCTSFYEVIPDVTSTNVNNEYMNVSPCADIASNNETSNLVRKQKKESPISDSSLALKRQIEQNIVISDEHYSEECLRVRKMRRGVLDGDVTSSQNMNTGITLQNTNQFSLQDTCNIDANAQDVSGQSTVDVVDSEYNSDDESPFNEVEKTVNINLGHEFLSQLDALFGREDMVYPEIIVPRINMPISVLNEINALWMESLMCQLEAESKSHEDMIKQDEEFARVLALEQLEITNSGKEPEVPNFKEIMDMEFALSLYRKDCEEWMQKDRPTDMAAKLSAKKLHDLFPELPHNDLDEIFMAHHYDFRVTVGVLLETQGRSDITQENDGIDKFIMAQELERQEKILAAEKKKLMEQKILELPSTIDMNTVNDYRNKAQLHLESWNKNFGMAKDMVKKNAAVANYYNTLASLHLMKYERANSIAAVSLLQIHARNGGGETTLDLHYLHVDEALAALDMFLDSHIQRHKVLHSRDKINTTLFIITGRGLHSRGGPKIKPAVKERLCSRGLVDREVNPGLLSVKICCEDRLSYEVP